MTIFEEALRVSRRPHRTSPLPAMQRAAWKLAKPAPKAPGEWLEWAHEE